MLDRDWLPNGAGLDRLLGKGESLQALDAFLSIGSETTKFQLVEIAPWLCQNSCGKSWKITMLNGKIHYKW